ncbi:MAG: hypothetical protein KIT87_07280 [Anaerolineae bacterium]|nr:hypothetical protein [Anaerolineae bacterium]
MNTKWLSTVRYVLRSLGALFFLLALAAHSLPGWMGLLGLAGLNALVLSVMIYRPPEDHLGVIMRWDHFSRWVLPCQWTLLVPLVDCLKEEINLQPRLLATAPHQTQTEEHIKVWVTLHVAFQFDPRLIQDFPMRNKILCLSDMELEGMVNKTVDGIVNNLIGGMSLDRVYRYYTNGDLALGLSQRVAGRLKPLGIRVNQLSGVVIHDLWIEEEVRLAMLQRLLAQLQGLAELDRLQPLLNEMDKHAPVETLAAALTDFTNGMGHTEYRPAPLPLTGSLGNTDLLMLLWGLLQAGPAPAVSMNGHSPTNGRRLG